MLRFVLAAVMLFSPVAMADDVLGTWEGRCSWWGDSTFLGAFTYVFAADGTYTAFIQAYRGSDECDVPAFQSPGVEGTYTAVPQVGTDPLVYDLVLSPSHTNRDRVATATRDGDTLRLCTDRCRRYDRVDGDPDTE